MRHYNSSEMLLAAEATSWPKGISRMSRRERLERWATLLEVHGGRLNALVRIEHLSSEEFQAYQRPNSPLTIAFNDPVLRREGLESERLGDVLDFFNMSDDDAHRLLCDCHYFGAMSGKAVASLIRSQIRREAFRSAWKRVLGRAMPWFARAAPG